jgi:hypothetical protein
VSWWRGRSTKGGRGCLCAYDEPGGPRSPARRAASSLASAGPGRWPGTWRWSSGAGPATPCGWMHGLSWPRPARGVPKERSARTGRTRACRSPSSAPEEGSHWSPASAASRSGANARPSCLTSRRSWPAPDATSCCTGSWLDAARSATRRSAFRCTTSASSPSSTGRADPRSPHGCTLWPNGDARPWCCVVPAMRASTPGGPPRPVRQDHWSAV